MGSFDEGDFRVLLLLEVMEVVILRHVFLRSFCLSCCLSVIEGQGSPWLMLTQGMPSSDAVLKRITFDSRLLKGGHG